MSVSQNLGNLEKLLCSQYNTPHNLQSAKWEFVPHIVYC